MLPTPLRALSAGLLIVAVSFVPAGAATGPQTVQIDTVTSTADGSIRVHTDSQTVTTATPTNPSVSVDVNAPRQRLRGVGAALTESSAFLIAGLAPSERHSLLESLFAPDKGGLSVLRIVIGASDFSLDHVSLADSPTPDPELTTFSIDRDRKWVIPVLKEILTINPDIEIIASPWSAPGWMKDTGKLLYGRLLETYEDAYARYLVRFVQAYRAEGIEVGWLTVQNEPANIQLTYPTMLMDAAQQVRLVTNHLAPALLDAGLDTRVLAWDHNWCDARPPGGCAGPAPAQFPLDVLGTTGATWPMAGTAFHCYGGDQATANDALHESWPDLEIWETECSGGAWQSAPFDDSAKRIIIDWGHWATASLMWNLALEADGSPHLGGCSNCRGVVTVDAEAGTWAPTVDYDVLATIARFGPAGSGVLATSVSAGSRLTATAVCSPDGRPSAIVFNPGDARTIDIGFGQMYLPVEVQTDSLTVVRAPEGTSCTVAAASTLPEPPVTMPPDPSTTPPPTTPSPTLPPSTSTPSPNLGSRSDSVTSIVRRRTVSPAHAVKRQPSYTG